MKKIWLPLLLGVWITFLVLPACAPEDDPCTQTMDKASEKLFKKARDLHKSGKKDEAFEIYNEILEEQDKLLGDDKLLL